MKYRNTMRQNNTDGNSQDITVAGAIDLRSGKYVYLTSATAVIANTLADGLFDGQEIMVKCVASGVGGSNVITYNATATATYDAVAEETTFVWHDSASDWEVFSNTATLA